MTKEIRKKFNKVPKKLLVFTIVLTMIISYFLPITSIFASANTISLSIHFRSGSENLGKVQYSLDDGANWIDVTQNSDLSIAVTGDNLRLKIVPNQDNVIDYAGIEMIQDETNIGGLSTIGFESNNGYAVPSDVEEVVLHNIEFKNDDTQPGGGSDTSDYQGNGESILNYSINGVIEYTSGGGFDHGISFRINDLPYKTDESKMTYTEDTAYERDEYGQIKLDDNNQPIPILDPNTHQPLTEKVALNIAGDTIHYDYDTNTEKVNFTFTMAPGTLMTGLKINNQTISNLPSTSDELLAHYTDHRLEINVNDIPKADTYNIEITARYPNSSEEFMGSFLWDYNPDGYTSSEEKILNGTIEFVKAEYDGHVYTTADEINALGGVYLWKDAERKDAYSFDREGVGEAQFPKGTKLTIRIIPDSGYQLVDFGVNDRTFETQDEIGTYTFIVNGGPFHLRASIVKVDDVVNTQSEKISAGAIELSDERSMSIGTARLDVKDIELTSDEINNFEKAADGYKVKNYLDISLFNTVYKGTQDQSWDTEVRDLDNEAVIFLQLEENANGEDIVLVHEKHDGTYEIIPTEYLKEYNAIMFKTKSFSNYAIASKTSSTNDDISNKDSSTNPHTGDNIQFYILMLGLSIIGLAGVVFYNRKRRFN